MIHAALPLKVARELATPVCPMRVWQDPQVRGYLELHRRVRGFGLMPRAGGLEDQLARDLDALEVIDGAMNAPWPEPVKPPGPRRR